MHIKLDTVLISLNICYYRNKKEAINLIIHSLRNEFIYKAYELNIKALYILNRPPIKNY